MALRPTHLSTKQNFTATRAFTDREGPRKLFTGAVSQNPTNETYQLLTFYGVGGQGKSRLCNKFIDMMGEEEAKSEQPLSWAKVNFELGNHRRIDNALLELRLKLRETGKLSFPAFDFAFARYQALAYPGTDIRAKYPELFNGENELIEDVVDITSDLLSEIPGFDFVYKYGSRLSSRFNEWWRRRGAELLADLDTMNEDHLLHELPKYLGADLCASMYKGEQTLAQRRIVILLDTYEALWRDTNLKDGHASSRTDRWVRRLVQESPGVLFVILGRDKVRWGERDPDWESVLDQHLLGGLSDEDADRFLQQVPIPEQDIRDTIVDSAKGLAFYLDLQVSIYEDEKNHNNSPTLAMFGGKDNEIIARFINHVDSQVETALKVMAQARYFDEELFNHLCKNFLGGAATIGFKRLVNHSFINLEGGRYSMHGLMRDYLVEHMADEAPVLYQQVHDSLFNWYDKFCTVKDVIKLQIEHEWALTEAAYHLVVSKRQSFPAWSNKRCSVFEEGAKYNLIEPIYHQALSIAQDDEDDNHPNVSTCLNNLGRTWVSLGEYQKAIEYYELALASELKTYGEDDPSVASYRNNLGCTWDSLGEYQKAIEYYELALASDLKTYGEDDPSVASVRNNLGMTWRSLGEYQKAMEYYELALASGLKTYGEDHPSVALYRNNLESAKNSLATQPEVEK